jgi:hypothetical protein
MGGWARAPFVAALAVAAAVPAAVPSATSAAPPLSPYAVDVAEAACPTGPLVAARMPRRTDPGACPLVGRHLTHGPLSTRVPAAGTGVRLEGLTTSGEWSLDVRTRLDGAVVIRSRSPLPSISPPARGAANDTVAGALPLAWPWTVPDSTVGTTVDADDLAAEASCDAAGEYIRSSSEGQTVWYSLAPTASTPAIITFSEVVAHPDENGYQDDLPFVALFTRDAAGTFQPVACDVTPGQGVRLEPGLSYYVRVMTRFGGMDYTFSGRPPTATEMPANDAFSAAAPLAVGETGTVQTFLYSSVEPGEPVPPCGSALLGSVWYRVDPGAWRRLRMAWADDVTLTLWQGSSLGSLAPLGCFSPPLQPPDAGYLDPEPARWALPTTGPFYLQVGSTRETGWDNVQQVEVESGEGCPECPPPCSVKDNKQYPRLLPRKPWRWSFNNAKGLKGLAAGRVLVAAKRAARIITGSTNDCGLPDKVSAKTYYLGRTSRRASECHGTRDGRNVLAVQGGNPGFGLLAMACYRYLIYHGEKRHRIIESDVEVYSYQRWTDDADGPTCDDQYDLVGTLAHEIGHVFALDHVAKDRAQNLTMAPVSAPPCNGAGTTLGRGDVLSLRKLY